VEVAGHYNAVNVRAVRLAAVFVQQPAKRNASLVQVSAAPYNTSGSSNGAARALLVVVRHGASVRHVEARRVFPAKRVGHAASFSAPLADRLE